MSSKKNSAAPKETPASPIPMEVSLSAGEAWRMQLALHRLREAREMVQRAEMESAAAVAETLADHAVPYSPEDQWGVRLDGANVFLVRGSLA